MGTVNLLELVRQSAGVHSVVIITTDKVYKNNEWPYGYRETDTLGGSDPYAASKACAEIVCDSYRKSFLTNLPLSTARAGNVIGGGDVAENRIIPDCVRAALKNEEIIIRNPSSVRPYQHVLEPLFAYLLIAEKQSENSEMADSYNIGPSEADCLQTSELADIFCAAWGNGLKWTATLDYKAPHEAKLLRLDCSKIRTAFGWKPLWSAAKAVEMTVEWEKAPDKPAITDQQIDEYMETFI
jgi:CDP-glucose 4,6-dehydratase